MRAQGVPSSLGFKAPKIEASNARKSSSTRISPELNVDVGCPVHLGWQARDKDPREARVLVVNLDAIAYYMNLLCVSQVK